MKKLKKALFEDDYTGSLDTDCIFNKAGIENFKDNFFFLVWDLEDNTKS